MYLKVKNRVETNCSPTKSCPLQELAVILPVRVGAPWANLMLRNHIYYPVRLASLYGTSTTDMPAAHLTTRIKHHSSHILFVFTSHYWILTILYLSLSFNYSLINYPLSSLSTPKNEPNSLLKIVGSWEAVDSDSWQPFSWVFWVYSSI